MAHQSPYDRSDPDLAAAWLGLSPASQPGDTALSLLFREVQPPPPPPPRLPQPPNANKHGAITTGVAIPLLVLLLRLSL